jgi:hypothetical protein
LKLASLGALLFAAVIPAVCSSSAEGPAPWDKLDFTARTHLGVLHVQMAVNGVGARRTLGEVKLEMNGRRLAIPAGVKYRVAQPQVHAVELTHTASVACLDDDCPDISQWPATLSLPFGERKDGPDGDSCRYSLLRFSILKDRIEEIEIWDCNEKNGEFDDDDHVLFHI